MSFNDELLTINQEMDAIGSFIDDMTPTQLANVVRIQLKQRAFKLLYQQKQNVVSRHYQATTTEWLIRHGLQAGEEMMITEEMKVSIYGGTPAEAEQAWIAEMNTIDAEINTTMQTMVKPTLAQSVVFCRNAKLKVDGFETKIDNMLKAAIVASYKE